MGCDVTTYKLGLSGTMLVVETLLCFFANCFIYVKEMNLKQTVTSNCRFLEWYLSCIASNIIVTLITPSLWAPRWQYAHGKFGLLAGGGYFQKKLAGGGGCAAHFSKLLPYLWPHSYMTKQTYIAHIIGSTPLVWGGVLNCYLCLITACQLI